MSGEEIEEKFRQRRDFLNEVTKKINGDRQIDYGDARESFDRIAALWTAYLGEDVFARDVAIMLALMKISRLRHTISHGDSWIDLTGYAVLGATMYEKEPNE